MVCHAFSKTIKGESFNLGRKKSDILLNVSIENGRPFKVKMPYILFQEIEQLASKKNKTVELLLARFLENSLKGTAQYVEDCKQTESYDSEKDPKLKLFYGECARFSLSRLGVSRE